MDGLDFQISEKRLWYANGIIEECHRRLVDNESILLVTQKSGFSHDTEAIVGDVFNYVLGITSEELPEVTAVRVLVEDHGCKPLLDKNGNLAIIPNWMDSIGEESTRAILDVATLQIMVYIIEKPASWEKFDHAKPFHERNDIKLYVNPNDSFDNTANWFISKIQERENFLQGKERVPIKVTREELQSHASRPALNRSKPYLEFMTGQLRYSSVFADFIATQQVGWERENAKIVPTDGDGKKIEGYEDKLGFTRDDGKMTEDYYHDELLSSGLLDGVVNTVWSGFDVSSWWYEYAQHLDEKNFLAWYHLGFIHYKQEEWEKAENNFRQCIRHNPSFSTAYLHQARLLVSRGLFKTALTFIDSGLEHSTKEDGWFLHRERGSVLMRLGQYRDAVSEFDTSNHSLRNFPSIEIPKSTPDDSEIADQTSESLYTSLMKVSALIVLRDIPEIILVYKNLVQESQDDLRSLNNLGYWYGRNGQHDEAADCWKRCLSVDPELWSPNASLGMRAKSDNDPAAATKFFKTSLKTCPDKARPIILEENMEMLQEYFDKEQLKTFGDKVADLSGFSLTGKSDVDEKNFVSHLRNCDGFIFWIDPYFSKGGLEWLEEACMPPTLIKEVRLLTVWKPKGRDEIFSKKFPRSFKPTAEKIRATGISFSFRVCVEMEYLKQIHQAFLMSKNGTWAIPRVMNIKVGSKDGVDPSTRKPSDFEEIWNNSLDYEKDYGELESKYNAWKAEQEE